MFRTSALRIAAVVLALITGVGSVEAGPRAVGLAVTMTNDPTANQIKVYDAGSGALLQTLSTRGKGGVGGNAGGVKQFNNSLVAVVNSGSGDVTVFNRVGNRLRFDKLVQTTSAPVSIDFGNEHMYVAGENTVDSFAMYRDTVGALDGSVALALATGGAPPAGSTAQIGVISDRRLLVTLKADPDPGTVDVVRLRDGAISGAAPTAVSGPAGSLTPFGFAVYGDGSAVITLAHSNQNGLFRGGAFTAVTDSDQMAPCWMTRAGKYVFTSNTASGTLSRLLGTGTNVFVDQPVAASIATGSPTDIDASDGLLAVIDHRDGESHLSLFTINAFGELTPICVGINLATANANGLALLVPHQD